jgi:hypothetical protein
MNYSNFELSQRKNYSDFKLTVDGSKNSNIDLYKNSNYPQTKIISEPNNAHLAMKGISYGLNGKPNGNLDDATLLFFSNDNVKRIQKMLRKEIFKRSHGKFKLTGDQREEDVIVAMRAVYLDNAKFLNFEIVRQVKLLNKLVIDFVAPGMLTNLRQAYSYIEDINKPLEPMPRSLNVNHGGRKELGSLTSVWNF